MRSPLQKIIVVITAIIVCVLSSSLDSASYFLWSIKGLIIPVLMTMLTLYTTLSMNLIRALDELPDKFRKKAMAVLVSMKLEMRIELVLLIVTFILMIAYPFFNKNAVISLWGRCVIDGLIVIDVVFFIIAIVDTYFGYLDLVNSQKNN